MKSLALLIGLFCCSTFSFSQELKPENYFDFWVGEWNVSWKEGNDVSQKGINIITKTLDSKVIEENFTVNSGNQKGYKGKSISVYQPQTGVWKQVWVDNQSGYFSFTGKIEGNKRIFETEVKAREDDKMFKQRMVFYDITENNFTWNWESSNDNGKTWNLNWQIFYERRNDSE